jgi:hypothetical protein
MLPILGGLLTKPDVQLELDINDATNKRDIAFPIRCKLEEISGERQELGESWPDEEPLLGFIGRAEGLFQLAAADCDYLHNITNPTEELRRIVSASSQSGNTSAGGQISAVYVTILRACHWRDKEFIAHYHRFLDTSVAAKAPLTVSAFHAFHQDKLNIPPVVLRQLSPLLTGLSEFDKQHQLIQALYQSFRDFITAQAQCCTLGGFATSEKLCSQDLALLRLIVLNCDLKDHTPGVVYPGGAGLGVLGALEVPGSWISDVLRYSWFWTDHILAVDSLAPNAVVEALETLLGGRAVDWVELTTEGGAFRETFRGLSKMMEWIQVNTSLTDLPQGAKLI